MEYSERRSVLKFMRYSGRRSRIWVPSWGGISWRRAEASRREARAPMATGVGVVEADVLVVGVQV